MALSFSLLAVVPGEAAASLTFDLTPVQPTQSQLALLVVHTWATDAGGRADQSTPLDMTGYPFLVRAYPAEELASTGATDSGGFGIQLQQVTKYTWNAQISFPSAGPWVVVFRNFYPPSTQTTPAPGAASVTIDVQTTPTMPPTGLGTGGTSLRGGLIVAAGVMVVSLGFVAAVSVRHRLRF